jgi:hypothetical protein
MAVIIVRSLMALLFLFTFVTFFFKLITPPPPTGAMKTFSDGLAALIFLVLANAFQADHHRDSYKPLFKW